MSYFISHFFRKVVNCSACFLAFILSSTSLMASVTLFSENKTYETPGSVVRYYQPTGNGDYQVAHFKNKWYITTDAAPPTFYPSDSPWQRVTGILNVTDNTSEDEISGDKIIPTWNSKGSYSGGNIVQHPAGNCYKAKWWTITEPKEGATPWESLTCPEAEEVTLVALSLPTDNTDNTDTTGNSDPTTIDGVGDDINGDSCPDGSTAYEDNTLPTTIPVWSKDGVYLEGDLVYKVYDGNYYFYKSKWWSDYKEEPIKEEPNPPWKSPWKWYFNCMPNLQDEDVAIQPVKRGEGVLSYISSGAKLSPVVTTESESEGSATKATEKAGERTKGTMTPVIPPVIAGKALETTTPASGVVPTILPTDGYEFLRLITDSDWNWVFPLRSGKVVSPEPCIGNEFLGCGGDVRNSGSSEYPDTFVLDNFKKAVLVYNHWANINGYKQFLNEGTLKQQAQEFIVFWAKSSRETSGSWASANAPWIVDHVIGNETITAWKGGLYWVEEVGYTTDPETGLSPAINYVDSGAELYSPAAGRSYYGRGIIQLSWNYNYGAFSYWLYDNKLLSDVVTERDTLLKFPNLVAENGTLSILSGIWFWMTPQGAKPSSHDVMYGDVYNISQTTQELGLAQTNDDDYTPPTAPGDTSDPEVYAYRIGTVINIVNGGLECNRAAKWHGGPVQRVYYYDAYAAYFNHEHNVGALRLGGEATASSKDAWLSSISADSAQVLQNATCYNQKSYYGW